MDIEPEDDDHRPLERNAHGQEGQGIGIFSIFIAAALAFQFTPLKDVRDNVNQYVKDQFAAAAKPKSQQECMMMALSRSPPVGCSPERK